MKTIQESSNQINANMKIFTNTLMNFTESTQNQAASTEEANASLEEGTAALENIYQNTTLQKNLSEETNSSIQGLESIIQEIDFKSKTALQITETTTRQAENGTKLIQETVAQMSEIRSNTEKISNTISVIQEISEQVNLLALNASIEAARAGDNGRGFAVVAQEIGKLAEGTAKNSKEIMKLVQSGLKAVGRGQTFVEDISKSLTSILEVISKFQSMITEISSKAKQIRVFSVIIPLIYFAKPVYFSK